MQFTRDDVGDKAVPSKWVCQRGSLMEHSGYMDYVGDNFSLTEFCVRWTTMKRSSVRWTCVEIAAIRLNHFKGFYCQTINTLHVLEKKFKRLTISLGYL